MDLATFDAPISVENIKSQIKQVMRDRGFAELSYYLILFIWFIWFIELLYFLHHVQKINLQMAYEIF